MSRRLLRRLSPKNSTTRFLGWPKRKLRGAWMKYCALRHYWYGLFMDSNWKPPSELPDLRNVEIVALDTETKDAGIRAERGSAWPWGDGYVCGVSVAYRVGEAVQSHYFPLRHP